MQQHSTRHACASLARRLPPGRHVAAPPLLHPSTRAQAMGHGVHGAADSSTRSRRGVNSRSTASSLTAPGAAAAAAGISSASTSASTSTAVVDDFAADQRPVILYDGVCNMCNGGVSFMLEHDPRAEFRLAALQSPAGRRLLVRCGRSPDDISSIVLVERNQHWIRSEAILRIGAKLRVPLQVLAAFGFPVPLPLRDAFYDAVANNRYSFFGRTQTCRLRDAGALADRFLVD